MKSALKVVLFGLLAAALALGVRWLYRQSADVINGGGSAWYEDKLLEAKELFLEKPDAVQDLTAVLVEEPEESFLRSADGTFVCLRDGKTTEASAEMAALLEPVFTGSSSGGEVLNVEVRPDAVLFYTCYAYGGCVGFLYEKELDETHYFEVFEIVENWKLFYKLKK